MTIKIEKGVQIPENASHGNAKYPWKALEIGDSFVAPVSAHAIYSSRIHAGARLGRKFIARPLTDKTCRVWRVE